MRVVSIDNDNGSLVPPNISHPDVTFTRDANNSFNSLENAVNNASVQAINDDVLFICRGGADAINRIEINDTYSWTSCTMGIDQPRTVFGLDTNIHHVVCSSTLDDADLLFLNNSNNIPWSINLQIYPVGANSYTTGNFRVIFSNNRLATGGSPVIVIPDSITTPGQIRATEFYAADPVNSGIEFNNAILVNRSPVGTSYGFYGPGNVYNSIVDGFTWNLRNLTVAKNNVNIDGAINNVTTEEGNVPLTDTEAAAIYPSRNAFNYNRVAAGNDVLVDAGVDVSSESSATADLLGNPRVAGLSIDVGPQELEGAQIPTAPNGYMQVVFDGTPTPAGQQSYASLAATDATIGNYTMVAGDVLQVEPPPTGTFSVDALTRPNSTVDEFEAQEYRILTAADGYQTVLTSTYTINGDGGLVNPDTTPDAISLTNIVDAPVFTYVSVTPGGELITGVDAGVDLPVVIGSGMRYRVSTTGDPADYGAYTSAQTNVQLGYRIDVERRSSSSNSATLDADISIGGVASQTATVTTVAAQQVDATPDNITLDDQTDAPIGSYISLTPGGEMITGMDAGIDVPVSAGAGVRYRISTTGNAADYGQFTTAPGVVRLGYLIDVEGLSGANYNDNVQRTITIAGFAINASITNSSAPVVNRPPVVGSGIVVFDPRSQVGDVIGNPQVSDADNDTLSYAIVGGNNSGVFTIDSNSGDIILQQTPEFQAVGGAYTLTIEVDDGVNSPVQSAFIVLPPEVQINIKPPVARYEQRGGRWHRIQK